MARIEVIINGKHYPCYATAGAMLRFAEKTGREVHEMRPGFTDMVTYLWCCACSSCAREKVEFDIPLQEFADCLSVEELSAMQKEIEESIKDVTEEKKTT